MKSRNRQQENGVALVVTVIVVAMLAVVGVALMQSVSADRASSRSVTNYMNARLAAEAGAAYASAMMATNMTNDHFIVVANTNRQLFVGSGQGQSAGTFSYIPLFSTASSVSNQVARIVSSNMPATNVTGGTNFTFTNLPGGLSVTSPVVSWIYLTNAGGQTNARFAFWVEDLSGKLDLSVAGTNTTNPVARRPTGTNPAELALWAVFNTNATAATNSGPGGVAADDLVAARPNILTPATARLVSTNVTADILADLAVNVRHDTNEPEIIPYGFGYSDQGKAKYNINTYISPSGVSGIAGVIGANLPQFAANRMGGFMGGANGYLQTLAANIIDYADADSNPTTDGDAVSDQNIRPAYRGVDSYPFVNEVNKRYVMTVNALTNYNSVAGRGIIIETTDFLELWNPSSVATPAGNLTFVSVHGQGISAGFLNASFSSPTWASNSAGAVSNGITTNVLSVPPLLPNGFAVLACPTVTNFFFVALTNPVTVQMQQETTGSSYHMGWNNLLVDAAIDGISRNQGNLSLGVAENRSQMPSFIYRVNASSFADPAVGDPRATLYIRQILDGNAYAGNSTFGGRNRRSGSVLPNASYYEVAPVTWPDGGHNSPPGNPAGSDNTLPTAVAAAAYSNVPPGRISNFGLYTNITEMGAIFDPIQWKDNSMSNGWVGKWRDLSTNSVADSGFGGGTTLRIGRPEHPRFNVDGARASQLLDIFAAGATNVSGSVIRQTPGRININTAGTNVLRALAAGVNHIQDPSLLPNGTNYFVPTNAVAAFVQGVTNFRGSRPFFSVSQLASISTNGVASEWPTNAVFGNADINVGAVSEWNDAAAEEWFSKVYALAAVRSRNFIIYSVGEVLEPGNSSKVISRYVSMQQVYALPMRGNNGMTTNSQVNVLRTWGL